MDNEYLSSDFSYKKYSLEQLDNWLHDAMNCEDLTPQDIYETIVKCVDDNIEYHKTHLTRNIELLSLLKGQRPVDLGENITEATKKDWVDFWEETFQSEKDKNREYNLREAEYYNKRAELDLEEVNKQLAIAKKVDSGEMQVESRNPKTHDQMIAEGWQMTDDGFWIKETDKGIASVSK